MPADVQELREVLASRRHAALLARCDLAAARDRGAPGRTTAQLEEDHELAVFAVEYAPEDLTNAEAEKEGSV